MIDRDKFQSRMQEKVEPLATPAMLACMSMMNELGSNFDPASATHAAAINTYGDALMLTLIAEGGEQWAHTHTDFKAIASILREAAEMFEAIANRSAN